MTRRFKGLNGSNPLGFLATVGLLRVISTQTGGNAHLGFADDGTFHPWIECDPAIDIAGIVAADAAASAGPQPWRLEYEKTEKKGVKIVADLKAPPEVFQRFVALAIDEWCQKRPEAADFTAAYATDIARDGKGNTKPTAFHFTAANQQFLGAVETTRSLVTRDWTERSLHLPGQTEAGPNLRWDPDAERSRALMGVNPTADGTVVNAPLEWLAFRALPTFPCVPIGNRVVTSGVTGRRQDELQFHWPLWSCGASYPAVRSLLVLTTAWLKKEEDARREIEVLKGSPRRRHSIVRRQGELHRLIQGRRARGVFAICSSGIRRTAQGFGNFGPALVRV